MSGPESRRPIFSCTQQKSTGTAPGDCIVVEDLPAGVSAAVAAGMTAIGFVGGGHAALNLGSHLTAAGARMVVADMRALKGAVVALRGH